MPELIYKLPSKMRVYTLPDTLFSTHEFSKRLKTFYEPATDFCFIYFSQVH